MSGRKKSGSNPWSVPPIDPMGDPNPGPLFMSVGQALTEWERLDQAQGMLFSELARAGHLAGNPVSLAYGMVPGYLARCEMVKHLAKAILGLKPGEGQLLADITKTLDATFGWSERRNEVAHGIVSEYTHSDSNGVEQNHGFYLAPAIFALRKQVPTDDTASAMANLERNTFIHSNKYAYTSAQIVEFAKRFDENRSKIVALLWRVKDAFKKEGLPPELRVLTLESQIRDLQTKLSQLAPQRPP